MCWLETVICYVVLSLSNKKYFFNFQTSKIKQQWNQVRVPSDQSTVCRALRVKTSICYYYTHSVDILVTAVVLVTEGVLNVHKWLVNKPRDKWDHIETASGAITME